MYKFIFTATFLLSSFLNAQKISYIEGAINMQTSKSEFPGLSDIKSFVPTFRLTSFAQIFVLKNYHFFTNVNMVKSHDFGEIASGFKKTATTYENSEGFDYGEIGVVVRKIFSDNFAGGFGAGLDVYKSDAENYFFRPIFQANILVRKLLISVKTSTTFTKQNNLEKGQSPKAHPFLFKVKQEDKTEYICPLLHFKVDYLFDNNYSLGAEVFGYFEPGSNEYQTIHKKVVLGKNFNLFHGVYVKVLARYDLDFDRVFYRNIDFGINVKYELFSAAHHGVFTKFMQFNHCIFA